MIQMSKTLITARLYLPIGVEASTLVDTPVYIGPSEGQDPCGYIISASRVEGDYVHADILMNEGCESVIKLFNNANSFNISRN